jgi:hypothetical protein
MRKALATFLREIGGQAWISARSNHRQGPTSDLHARRRPVGQTIEMTLNAARCLNSSARSTVFNETTMSSPSNDAVFGPRDSAARDVRVHRRRLHRALVLGIPFKTAAEIKAIFALLEEKALPLMEVSASMSGLNDLMNRPDRSPLTYPSRHPLAPESLAQRFAPRQPSSIDRGWMVGDPDFDRWVDEYRALMRVEKRSSRKASSIVCSRSCAIATDLSVKAARAPRESR